MNVEKAFKIIDLAVNRWLSNYKQRALLKQARKVLADELEYFHQESRDMRVSRTTMESVE